MSPDETTIGILTRKTKIASYVGQRFLERTTNLSDRLKYWRVILDRKFKHHHRL